MGRGILLTIVAALLAELSGSAFAEDIIELQAPFINIEQIDHFEGGRSVERLQTEEQLRAQVQQVLRSSRSTGEDAWTWRQSVEDRLTGFGDRILPILQGELDKRDGYEGDAVYVAMMRLKHDMPAPREALLAWARKRFEEQEPACRVMRVLGVRSVFENHLFYVVEHPGKKTRVVVAVAADGKVQPLEDNAAMTRFFRNEAETSQGHEARQRLSDAAALLVLARAVTAYRADAVRDLATGEDEAASEVEYQMNIAKARVIFDDAGRVEAVDAGMVATAKAVEAPPVFAPTGAAPPPPMPK